MKMKKLLGVLLALVMLFSLVPAMSLTAWADATVITTEDELRSALSAAGEATITLGADISISSKLTISGTKTLDLNDHALIGNVSNGSIIEIRNNATLNLTDNAQSKTTRYYTPQTSGPATIGGSGTKSFTGGYITGTESGTTDNNFDSGYHVGGGVYVANGSTLNMNGGNIVGVNHNGSQPEGAGVFVCGIFNMNGGVIAGNCNSNNGGGVGTSGGSTVTISGGSISDNKTNWGGGITVRNSFSMSSGEISGNTASGGGGGIHVDNAGGGTPSVTLTGGSITGNKSIDNRGGGIYCYAANSFTVSGSPVISGNKRGSSDENVYLPNGKMITVAGTLSNASIGVTMQSPPGVFTNSTTTDYNVAGKFSSDNSDYMVEKKSDGQLYLVAKPAGYSVILSGGTNATASGGAVSQSVTQGQYMAAVTYTANTNYAFASFSDDTTNGVTLHWVSAEQVKVSGMPTDNVEITVPDAIRTYTVTTGWNDGGAVSVSCGQPTGHAAAGASITVTATPNPGYEVESITVKYTDNEFTINSGGNFEMPEADVNIDVVFKPVGGGGGGDYGGGGDDGGVYYGPARGYRVSLAPMTGGSAYIYLSSGEAGTSMSVVPGSLVWIVTTPDPGYEVESIVCMPGGDITGGPSFLMPECDVTVYVTFRPVA